MPSIGTTKDWNAALGFEEKLAADIAAEKLEAEGYTQEAGEASYSREDAAAVAEADANFLAGLAMPTVFQYLFPPVLIAAWLLLKQSVMKERDFSKIALGIPRGHGKTTLIKLFILFCILFTKKKFILVIAETAEKAENIIADVVDMLNERNIVALFGDWKVGIEKDTQPLKKFGYRNRNIILAGLGVNGSLRGLNLKNERPDVMIFDDIQSAEAAESPVQSDQIERWMIGTAMKAKSPHGCLFIFAGNMFRTQHSILKKLKKNPTWIKFISGAILEDGTALWPQLRSLEELLQEFSDDLAAGHAEIFFAEVMNDTEVGINSKVDLSRLAAWKWNSYEQPQGKFILIDPSAGKKGSDLVAIGYFEIYDETPALRDVIEEPLSPGNTIRKALLMALKTGTRVIACEGTGYQSTLLYWFDQIATELGLTGFHFVEISAVGYSKNYRITQMLKALTAGETVLHPSVRAQVTSQIANWNPLKRDNVDNILDLLAHTTQVMEKYGALCITDTEEIIQETQAMGVDEGASWAF